MKTKSESKIQTTELRPIVKWAGGKGWLAPRLAALYEPFRDCHFVEMFAGGMALSFALKPRLVIALDTNRHLINLYQRIRYGELDTLSTDWMKNTAENYYASRDLFNYTIHAELDTTLNAAGLFYYLNRTGYNGLCRYNSKGLYNVPFGRYKSITYAKGFPDHREAMRGWLIACASYETLFGLPGVPADAFLYADPPYDDGFTGYQPGGFGWEDQQRLAAMLARHTGPVAASNKATDRILEMYRHHGFKIQIIDAPRRISCTGDRATVREMLATRGIR